MTAQKPSKLLYVGDPMCSWCYGIAEELSEVKKTFGDQIDFEMVMGGLRPYNTQTMSELKDFLSHHWEEVNSKSGQIFTYSILDSQEITYDTEPPCRASIIVRSIDKEKEFDFFKAVQKAFYFDNKNLHLKESYHPILKELSIDTQTFDKLFDSPNSNEKSNEDFNRARTLGVNSFPTLLLEHDGKQHKIAQGFETSENIIKAIRKIVSP